MLLLLLLFVNDWTLTPALFAIISFLFLNSAFIASIASLVISTSCSVIASISFSVQQLDLCVYLTPIYPSRSSQTSPRPPSRQSQSLSSPSAPFSRTPTPTLETRRASDFSPITPRLNNFFCCRLSSHRLNRLIYATSISSSAVMSSSSFSRCFFSMLKTLHQSAEARDFCR